MGNRQTDIRSGVLKQRLKPDGTAVGEVLKNDPWQCWPGSTLFFLFWRYFSFSIQAGSKHPPLHVHQKKEHVGPTIFSLDQNGTSKTYGKQVVVLLHIQCHVYL